MEGVRTKLHTRTDLTNFGCLLEYLDLPACSGKRKRCCESTNTATGNQDSLVLLTFRRGTMQHQRHILLNASSLGVC
jgi:hypothetical protein